MTATDELRRMLTDAGVEFGNIRNDGSESDYLTEWQFDGIQSYAVATEWAVGSGLSLETHQHHLTPEQAIAATLGGDNSDTVKRLMKLQGGHYSWPKLYEAVTGDLFDYECSPSESEEVFIEKLISIVGNRKVVD